MPPVDSGRTAVESSLITSIAYSQQATLEIEFRSGNVYRYFLVPHAIYEGLLAASSKGEYFNKVIRPAFRSERLV